MLKRFPSRNQRSKGIKVKHVLQIFLLLGICFWLVYQVKHSHDKKKEFDGNGAKTSIRRESENDIEILKLGRKDLPREEVTESGKPEEEEEEEVPITDEEEKRVEEREENGSRREEEQEENQSRGEEERGEEEEENKNEEAEDGGGGDDEIDENDQEGKDEDFVDEDKVQDEEGDDENRTIENEDIGDQLDNENLPEDQDSDGGDRADHEAREENYKADDASSEVTHEAHGAVNTEIKITTESADENLGTNNLNNTETVNENGSVTESLVGDGGVAENSTLNAGSIVQKVENSSSNSVDKFLETTQSNDQPQAGDNPVPMSTESTNGSAAEGNNSTAEVSTEATKSSTEMRNETSDPSLQNSNEESVSDSGHNAQHVTSGDNIGERAAFPEQTPESNINSENDKGNLNSAISAETEDKDGASKESSDSSNNAKSKASGNTSRPDKTAQVEVSSSSLGAKVNSDMSRDEKSEDNKSNAEQKTEEGSDSTNETDSTIQDDPIDSSDTQISQEVNKARTDLDTLPELRSQGDDNEEAAA